MPLKERLKMRHLHTLMAIADQGSLVRAAKVLSITQPAVTKTLAELEDIAGHLLFERSPKGMTLTGAGQVLLRHTGSGLRTIHEGLSSLSTEEEDAAPALAIGALPTVDGSVLAPALIRFAKLMPRAKVCVRTGSNAQLMTALKQGVLDMVIGHLGEPSVMQGLRFEHLYSEPYVLVVRPGHDLSLLQDIDPAVLRDCRFVMPDTGTRAREAANRFFMAVGTGLPLLVIETIDVPFARSYVLNSDAIWSVSMGAVENDLEQGRLVRLNIDTSSTKGPIGMTFRMDHTPSEPLQRVTDEIRQIVAKKLAALSTSMTAIA